MASTKKGFSESAWWQSTERARPIPPDDEPAFVADEEHKAADAMSAASSTPSAINDAPFSSPPQSKTSPLDERSVSGASMRPVSFEPPQEVVDDASRLAAKTTRKDRRVAIVSALIMLGALAVAVGVRLWRDADNLDVPPPSGASQAPSVLAPALPTHAAPHHTSALPPRASSETGPDAAVPPPR